MHAMCQVAVNYIYILAYRPDSESLYTGGTPRNRANVGAADRRHSKCRSTQS